MERGVGSCFGGTVDVEAACVGVDDMGETASKAIAVIEWSTSIDVEGTEIIMDVDALAVLEVGSVSTFKEVSRSGGLGKDVCLC